MTEKESLALGIVQRLSGQGYQALYAGGYVRDKLLGSSEPGDIDIATNATPSTVTSLFKHTVRVGEHFGVMVVVEGGIPFEVATFRSDQGIQDGRHPAAVVFTDAEHDALRRDFTINGMFYDPQKDAVIDYINGRQDLQDRMIRAIGDPLLRFSEDYLRLLRAIRFAARFGFTIDKATWQAIIESSSSITRISAERIFMELDKMLTGNNPDKAFALLNDAGLMQHILPEISALKGIQQPVDYHPEGDVLQHTLLALSLLKKPSQVLAWSTLLHDIGKPVTQSNVDRIRFNNHHFIGARMAETVLKRLRASNKLIEDVCACIDNHMNFINVKNMRISTLKRFLSRPTFSDELEMHRIDCLASHSNLDNYDFLNGKSRELAVSEIKPPSLLSGKDLISLGFAPGPKFGIILGQAYDLQLEDKLKSHDAAIEWVKANHTPA